MLTAARAQVIPEPQREQLLNGLPVYLWQIPGDKDVLIKLRIHSGAAFDVAGKAGEMVVLGDLLFPDPTTREYFTEAMAGRLEVDTNYDAITVTMQGRAAQFERIIEILRTALVSTQITPENVAKIREGRTKITKETAISPSVVADRAIAARLFGDFPYGRPVSGSVESLSRIDRADLLLARERFLNANNSTLTITGGVQRARAIRALRQLLGPWRKSEQNVPSTFRQPEPPALRALIVNAPSDQSAEVRLATRGLARSDRDSAAASILALVARKRWETLLPELTHNPTFVRNDAHVLPGMFVMGAGGDTLLAARTIKTAREVIQSLSSTAPSAAEVEQAKSEVVSAVMKDLSTPNGISEAWLDIDTYSLPPVAEQLATLKAVSPADIQRVASRIFKEGQVASVVIGNSKQLQAVLEPTIKVELVGELEPPPNKTEPKAPTMTPLKKPE